MQVKEIGYKDIFGQKEYMKMIVAALINRFGDSIDAIAFTWIVYEITGNAVWSAIIFGINRVPSVLITPLAGAWVEGRDKKYILVGTDIIRACCVAIVATGYLLGFLQEWILVITTILISTAEAFRGPANMALIPQILEKKYYEYALSLMSTLSSIAELIGTAIAAGIIALIGSAGAIYIDMLTFILSALIILMVNIKEKSAQKQKFDTKEYMRSFCDGFKYVKKDKLVLFLCAVAVFLNAILVPFNSLQAPLANELLQGGAEVLSILGIALTLGMVLGSSTYPIMSKYLDTRNILFSSGMVLGLYYLALVLCKPFYEMKWFMYIFVFIASAIFGFVLTIGSSLINVEFVKRTDEHYLARAASFLTAFSAASAPIVAFLISGIAVFVKTEWIFIWAGIIDIVVTMIMYNSKILKEVNAESNSIVLETIATE